MSTQPEFGGKHDMSVEAAELYDDSLKIMTAQNIDGVKKLFETPPNLVADLALEHMPEIYGERVTLVTDDERHGKILVGQLKSLGVRQLLSDEPYLNGKRRIYEAVLVISGNEDEGVGLPYYLDEQHTVKPEVGPVLNLRATRGDPRVQMPVMEKLRELESHQEARRASSISRRMLEPHPRPLRRSLSHI